VKVSATRGGSILRQPRRGGAALAGRAHPIKPRMSSAVGATAPKTADDIGGFMG
jgi:hypothetical protein